MPTKRRFIIFLIVLTLMLLIKRAVGQEAAVGWDPALNACFREPGIGEQSIAAWLFGIIFGSIGGFARSQQRMALADKSQYFTGDLIQLRLQ